MDVPPIVAGPEFLRGYLKSCTFKSGVDVSSEGHAMFQVRCVLEQHLHITPGFCFAQIDRIILDKFIDQVACQLARQVTSRFKGFPGSATGFAVKFHPAFTRTETADASALNRPLHVARRMISRSQPIQVP